ncbi:alpha-tocopherol transfer protein [Musca domestica]|uniref:Alpha-tocopherol transfer protein n=1 Tax=Musca domestica TaxID=7370 RepID=A0A1I8MVJ9_MUSDO|nr:alpha-tocopherol transfer protein [Musca domestica]
MLNSVITFTPQQLEKINDLRNLVEDSLNLSVGTDDIFLAKFLSFKNWHLERAYVAIHNYYDFKAENPDWMAHHHPAYFREQFLDVAARFVMPQPDKEGRPILIIKLVDVFEKYPNYLLDSAEMEDLIFESLLLLPQTQENGLTVIFDMTGFNLNFLPYVAPRITRMIHQKDKILPFKKRYVHFILGGAFISAITTLLMPLMHKEFKENTFNHDGKNFDKLRNMIGYANLPADYGGPETNKLKVNLLWNHIEKHSTYLYNLQQYHKRKRH